jgi:hypothetical protein
MEIKRARGLPAQAMATGYEEKPFEPPTQPFGF